MTVLALVLPVSVFAQETREVRANDAHIISSEGGRLIFEAIGEDGVTYRIDSDEGFFDGPRHNVREGQDVILQVAERGEGEQSVFLIDIVRTKGLLLIFFLFSLVTIIVGLKRGVFALAGLVLTLAVIFGFIFPRILGGADAVGTTIVGSLVILAVNMHLAHGLNRRTFAAFLSTVVGLFLAWLFAHWFVSATHLSGLASEEAAQLFLGSDNMLVPRGILLSGILLGAVGVLDDIAITQSEIVTELETTNPSMSRSQLFRQAMRVGRHHIASVVNTLVLAYAGAAMPIFLLFMSTDSVSLWRFVNDGLIAEEIVRTFAGTLALILLVPLATLAAVSVRRVAIVKK